MFTKCWDLLTVQEAKEQLLEMLDSPSFISDIAYEPALDIEGKPEPITFALPEEGCKKVASAYNADGFSCGSFKQEDVALAAIRTVILAEIDEFAKWLVSSRDSKVLHGFSNKNVAYVYINENGKVNRYETNQFTIRFDRDVNNISEYGFLVTSLRPIKS